ncbi:MAG: BrnT family toxin [Rhodospirillaceae bacterium]
MRWTWDPGKNEANRRKHGLGFETARRVFDDPLALSVLDTSGPEERWLTVGTVEGVTLLVVHTWHQDDETGEAQGRIISARKATRHETKAYEDSAL